MSAPPTATRVESTLAYALSAIASLVWVGCVIPAGHVVAGAWSEGAGVPLQRETVLLVPALLLLTGLPVGATLARRVLGQRAVLASTDAFVGIYSAIVLGQALQPGEVMGTILVVMLYVLGTLSLFEALRAARSKTFDSPRSYEGIRLALCLLVIAMPSRYLMIEGVDRANWLWPFVFIALGATGARVSRSIHGLRLTSAALQIVLAAHLIVTLRYTIFEGAPALSEVTEFGEATLYLAYGVLGVALLQFLLLLQHVREAKARELLAA